MLNFHSFLDKYFGQRLTFSIFFRIWLSIAIVVILASGLAFYQLQKTLKPSAQRVVEDTLVDISRMLAVTLSPAIASGEIHNPLFTEQLKEVFSTPTQAETPIWYDQKTQSQLHIYITDNKGVVIYDSKNQDAGKDYSRWNDVHLTLQGKYGARSTRTDPNDPTTSVMYVASQIRNDHKNLLGVVSVGKPVRTIAPYIKASEDDLIHTLLTITVLVLGVAGLMALWLRHSIQVVNRYTQNLAPSQLNDQSFGKSDIKTTTKDPKITTPHFYLGKELNQLVTTIDTMKQAIENKAYVTDYVHTLTHELKSPLTAIRASGELLAEDLPAHDREQFSHTILDQADKLQQLVEQLLLLAKIEQPSFKLSLENVAINDLISLLLSHQQAWLQQKQLTIQMLASQNYWLIADKFWLQQALQNVIDNAIKFAQNFILIAIEKQDNCLMLSVMNDSPMLPEFVVEKAFERYFSQSLTSIASPYRQQKGTGLGLTLVKQVITHHQGQVSFEQGKLAEFLSQDNLLNHASLLNQHCVRIKIRLPF